MKLLNRIEINFVKNPNLETIDINETAAKLQSAASNFSIDASAAANIDKGTEAWTALMQEQALEYFVQRVSPETLEIMKAFKHDIQSILKTEAIVANTPTTTPAATVIKKTEEQINEYYRKLNAGPVNKINSAIATVQGNFRRWIKNIGFMLMGGALTYAGQDPVRSYEYVREKIPGSSPIMATIQYEKIEAKSDTINRIVTTKDGKNDLKCKETATTDGTTVTCENKPKTKKCKAILDNTLENIMKGKKAGEKSIDYKCYQVK